MKVYWNVRLTRGKIPLLTVIGVPSTYADLDRMTVMRWGGVSCHSNVDRALCPPHSTAECTHYTSVSLSYLSYLPSSLINTVTWPHALLSSSDVYGINEGTCGKAISWVLESCVFRVMYVLVFFSPCIGRIFTYYMYFKVFFLNCYTSLVELKLVVCCLFAFRPSQLFNTMCSLKVLDTL